MNNYHIRVIFEGPYSTPLQADTIFGCLCWAMRYVDGEKQLEEFLGNFSETPLLVSNGFPKGKIPRPIVPPIGREEVRKLINQRIGNSKKDLALGLKCIKKLKKQSFLDIDSFTEIRESYSDKVLMEKWLIPEFVESVKTKKEKKEPEKQALLPHNTIDRITTRPVEKGGLFFDEATFFDRKRHEDARFDLYLSTDIFEEEKLGAYFEMISAHGFGKDASTGKGHFKFKISEAKDELFNFSGNRFMTLSNGTLDSDVSKPYYSTITKYGKLGGHFAVDETNPFKKPILMVQAGSTFESNKKRPYYGGLLSDVHTHRKEIRHYGCLYPIMFNMEAE